MFLKIFIIIIFSVTYALAQDEYMANELKPIKENFKRINSISNWTDIRTIETWETTEGGEINYYLKHDKLLKIIIRQFGETRQSIHELYLLNGQLSFSFYKEIIYNRPITWDSTAMLENNDNQVFDFNKSEIEEVRSYFSNQQLIRQINNQDCGSPFAKEYLNEEQSRLNSYYKHLLDLLKL